MSMHSYQVDQARLCLHWKGQKCVLSGGHGIVGCQKGGDLRVFDPAEMAYLEGDWSLLLGYERAHGWLSFSRLRASVGLCINGHHLNTSPLMMKESAFMMPPHGNTSIELFLTESLADWGDVELEPAFIEVGALESASVGVAQGDTTFATTGAAVATSYQRKLEQKCSSDYGLVSPDGKLVEISLSYSFGAVRFEIADDECWVFVDDGTLHVNGFQRITSQVFVGDQLQWQGHSWLVQGTSTQQRVEAQTSEFCLQADSLSSLDLEDDLFPEDQESKAVGEKVLGAQVTGDSVAQDSKSIPPEEIAAFRNRLALWLDSSPSLNPLDGPKLRHPMDHYYTHTPNSEPAIGSVSHLALLRLGRRNHFWKNLDLESQPHQERNIFPTSEDTGSSLGSMKTLSKVLLIGTLAVAVLGVVGLIASVLLF